MTGMMADVRPMVAPPFVRSDRLLSGVSRCYACGGGRVNLFVVSWRSRRGAVEVERPGCGGLVGVRLTVADLSLQIPYGARRPVSSCFPRLLERELLHTACGGRFARVYVAFGINGQVVQCRCKLSRAKTTLAERSQDAHLSAKQNPDFLIRAVGNVHEGLIRRKIKVGYPAAPRSRLCNESLFDEGAVFAKNLKAAVATIADIHEAIAIDSEAVHSIAELPRRRAGRIDGSRRGRIIRPLAIGAPMPFVRTRLGVEHDHTMVLVLLAIRHVNFVAPKIDAHLRRAGHIRRVVAAAARSRAADLPEELPFAGKHEDVRVLLAFAADPDAVFRVNGA